MLASQLYIGSGRASGRGNGSRLSQGSKTMMSVHWVMSGLKKHSNDNWTWGSLNKKYKELVFHPDMFSHKLKLVFLYDGISHFKTIYRNQDLLKSKLKLKVLLLWCIQNGYKLLRISESWFHSIGKDVSIVLNILYSLLNPVTKLGAEYQE